MQSIGIAAHWTEHLDRGRNMSAHDPQDGQELLPSTTVRQAPALAGSGEKINK